MKSYLSVYSATTYEKVIERSRFIANCAHAESEEEGIPILSAKEETFEITGRLYEALKAEQTV